MDNVISAEYEALDNYFNLLKYTGSTSECEVDKLLLLGYLIKFYKDFQCVLSDLETKKIYDIISCILTNSCLVPIIDLNYNKYTGNATVCSYPADSELPSSTT